MSGVACTGCSGEDYVVPGRNALVMQTSNAREFVHVFHRMRAHPAEEARLRVAARRTAVHFAWTEIVRRHLLPTLELD